jgi:hypothetical protein
MTEEEQSPDAEKRCLVCQVTSEERVLLCGVEQNRDVWVCVRCLPMLIHGVH